MKNLNLAFDIAEKYLDIPKMLDADGKKLIFLKIFQIETFSFKLKSLLHLLGFFTLLCAAVSISPLNFL